MGVRLLLHLEEEEELQPLQQEASDPLCHLHQQPPAAAATPTAPPWNACKQQQLQQHIPWGLCQHPRLRVLPSCPSGTGVCACTACHTAHPLWKRYSCGWHGTPCRQEEQRVVLHGSATPETYTSSSSRHSSSKQPVSGWTPPLGASSPSHLVQLPAMPRPPSAGACQQRGPTPWRPPHTLLLWGHHPRKVVPLQEHQGRIWTWPVRRPCSCPTPRNTGAAAACSS